MLRSRILAIALALPLALPLPLAAQYKPKYSVEQFLSPPFPLVFASAKSADRIAWVGYDRGKRNIYTAAAPAFTPVKLTQFNKDDGQDITAVEVSDDGSTIVFVRGTNPNNRGWVPNPDHSPDGAVRAIWAVSSIGGTPAVKLIDSVTGPQVSPDGKQILYMKDGQIYRARFPMPAAPTAMDRGDVPFIAQWGAQSAPRWSPDGSKIVFVSDRGDHSFIGIYDVKTRTITYPFPGVDRDAAPSWSQDGKRFAFSRRPGSPFGSTVVGVVGAAGAAGSAAMNPAAANAGRGGRGAGVAQAGVPGGGRGGRGGGGGRGALVEGVGGAWTPEIQSLVLTKLTDTTTRNWKGMFDERFADGSTLKLMTYTLATNQVKEFWTNDSLPPDMSKPVIFPTQFDWQGDAVVFRQQVPNDDWDRFYAIKVDEPNAKPYNLITTDGMIEGATSVTFSADGKTMYYCTNATDIEHRHIWSVPTSGGAPTQLTKGDGIHTSPLAMGSGKYLGVLYADAKMPELVAVLPTTGGKARVIEKLPADFPMAAHVVPEVVYTTAADGIKISNELFLPADLKPGEKRPAIVFVHGGSQRQMLPGYHYMQFYHQSYAINQWLATQGYVVMSINYRTGIGYGNAFRAAKNSGARGNSEYLDVIAGGKYLQSRADVDPARIGIWGLSYGGDLASQALARNSDMFVAGADLAGVHLWGNSLNPQDISFQSSTISAIDKWKSPVFLVQGDDDRNVAFTQMMGLVHLLRQRNVYYDLTIIPDDLHESMIHTRWVDTWDRMGAFFHDYVWEKKPAPPGTASVTRTVPK